MSEAYVQLQERLHRAEVALLQRDKADATEHVARMCESGQVLPKGQGAWVEFKLNHPELFAKCAESLATVDFTTVHGSGSTPDAAPQKDFHTAVAERTTVLMGEGKDYATAHSVAMREITREGQ